MPEAVGCPLAHLPDCVCRAGPWVGETYLRIVQVENGRMFLPRNGLLCKVGLVQTLMRASLLGLDTCEYDYV